MIIKSNSKESEKVFIENIKKFFDNPEVLLPQCTDSCFMCPIKGYSKKIEKMKDSGNFGKYHNSADQFLAGVSETYKILENEKAPLMGMIKTNYGSVNYCKRGNADEIIIAGIQNYDNDIYRLLAFTNVVKLKKLRVYSTKNYFTATCRDKIDMNFIEDLLKEENVPYSVNDGRLVIGNSGNKINVQIYDGAFEVYEDFDGNIVHIMLKHMLLPDIPFVINSDFMDFIPDNQEIINEFIQKRLTTKQLMARIRKDKTAYAIKNNYYVIGSQHYTLEEFLEKLEFDEKLRPFIGEKISSRGFVLDSPSQRKILEYLFPQYKTEIVKLLYNLSDAEIKSLKGNPMEVMENAKLLSSKKSMASKIMDPWSENSKYLIDLLTYYFNYGKADSIKFGRKNMHNDIEKSIYYAFLRAIGNDEEWIFSENQILLGKRIYEYMDDMVNNQNVNEQLKKLKGII
ncbi:MAG: hypothetical protein RE471_02380 [Ferroplasma sp.]|uniref:hypothetical protein n=1 Tax=Ferroplasma sp. TaxID=2591003 RepID=UPI00281584A5|nr:hypothetical protein [Ferroplasma sp.]WMT51741.1 MAG: hypothetical protein RE471_02380 [Ferroplasma sp.]